MRSTIRLSAILAAVVAAGVLAVGPAQAAPVDPTAPVPPTLNLVWH